MTGLQRHTNRSWQSVLKRALSLPALCLVVLCLLNGSADAQDELSTVQPEVEEAVLEFPESVWMGEGTVLESEGSIAPPALARIPPVVIYTDPSQEIPVLKLDGQYFDPSSLTNTGSIGMETNLSIRNRMTLAEEMGFKCFMLRVDWVGLEPEQNRMEDGRILELLSTAEDLGLKVLISLDLTRAPAWFFNGAAGPGRLMSSFLVDPQQRRSIGNDGDLRWANGTGVPIFYHEDTLRAIENLVFNLYYAVKDKPAFIGWLVDGPVTLAFPGGGRDGVVGMCDYSPHSVQRFIAETSGMEAVYGLPRNSQGDWDNRMEWRTFMSIRLGWKREAFLRIIDSIADVDPDHIILIGMQPVLNYRNDNGYTSTVQASDSTWQLLNPDIDGAVIGFRLASNSFEALNMNSESSAMHLLLTINQVLRNGKLALVTIEPDNDFPPSVIDIDQIGNMIKAAGAYPVWTTNYINRRGRVWSYAEENAIERSQALAILPPPHRLRRGNVGIFDIPQFYGNFYSEWNKTLVESLLQLTLHQRTGVVLEVVGVDEIHAGGAALDRYSNMIYLAPELGTDSSAKSWIDLPTRFGLNSYDGTFEAVDPMLLHRYQLEDFNSPVLEDQLRTRYVYRGAVADFLHGADAFIVANDPYVFIRINSLNKSKYIDVKLAGWSDQDQHMMDFVELPTSHPVTVEMISGSASFRFGPTQNVGFLYIQDDDYAQGRVGRQYEKWQVGVAVSQQSRNMRRSVPAALLLAVLVAVTMIWMTFQTKQKSLLQAAELVDRSRKYEPIDILDDAEVMAFYKNYLSTPDEQQSPPAEPYEDDLKSDREPEED